MLYTHEKSILSAEGNGTEYLELVTRKPQNFGALLLALAEPVLVIDAGIQPRSGTQFWSALVIRACLRGSLR